MESLTMGSLFSGLGGFELASIRNGIRPVWASDIEPYPIAVTRNHFPNMRHVGSVTEISGTELEPVDIITFGSPCQDLSVAGKQAGIHDGARSSLFFEAVRIIKEMRDKDIAGGRTDQFIRPRFAVWENVPGAFSSNKGQDFQAVLQALCSIRGGQSHIVPLPPKGKWLPAGNIVGNGFSLAWRVLDAAGWGVPQRRKRIFLVADFAGERAAEILFDENRLHGHSASGGEAGKGTAADAQGSAGRSSDNALIFKDREGGGNGGKGLLFDSIKSYTCGTSEEQKLCYPAAFMGGQGAKAGSIAYADDGSTPTLKSAPSGGNTVPDVVYPINTMVATRGGKDDGRTTFGVGEANDPQFTLGAAHEHAVCYRQAGFAGYDEGVGTLKASGGDVGGVLKASSSRIYDARGNGDGKTIPTLTGDHENRITDYTALCVERKVDE